MATHAHKLAFRKKEENRNKNGNDRPTAAATATTGRNAKRNVIHARQQQQPEPANGPKGRGTIRKTGAQWVKNSLTKIQNSTYF